jgi:hypothetical protein
MADSERSIRRRTLLGAVSGAVFGGLAGCSGDDSGNGTTTTDPVTGTDPPGDTPTTTATSARSDTATQTPTEGPTTSTTTPPAGPEWTELFDGESLENWTRGFEGLPAGEAYKNTFRVEDGILRVAYDEYGGSFDGTESHLYYDGTFSHFAVRVEYRFPGTFSGGTFRNSGVMVHGPEPENALGDEEFDGFPDSIEMQLLGQDEGGGQRTTANLCTPGTHVVMDGELTTDHCINSSSDTYPGDQWVTATAVVRGNEEIRHYVEGEEVLSYTEPQLNDGTLLDSGTVSLQSEGSPIDFRRVELLEIDPDTPLGEGFVPPTPASVSVDWDLPGEIRVTSEETTTVTTEVTNEDEEPIFDGEISLEPSSSDITVSANGDTTFDSLASGDTRTTEWAVTLPGELDSGEYTLRGVVAYTSGGTTSEASDSLSFTVL